MKLAKLWYFCGLGLIILGVASIIYGILDDNLVFGVGRGIFGLFWGFWWMRIGARKMQEQKLGKTEQSELGDTQMRRVWEGSPEELDQLLQQHNAFVKENCIGCKFADEDAIEEALDEKSGEALLPLSSVIPSVKKEWCLRPEPPECDRQYCYSREIGGT